MQDEIFKVALELSNNPRLIFSIMQETIEEAAPDYIKPIIEQGIADGSICKEYPAELADLVLLAANIWMNPMIFDDTEEKSYRKFMVFAQMMKGLGLDIVDEEMLERLQQLASICQKNK